MLSGLVLSLGLNMSASTPQKANGPHGKPGGRVT
jgi:hypothetical protein